MTSILRSTFSKPNGLTIHPISKMNTRLFCDEKTKKISSREAKRDPTSSKKSKNFKKKFYNSSDTLINEKKKTEKKELLSLPIASEFSTFSNNIESLLYYNIYFPIGKLSHHRYINHFNIYDFDYIFELIFKVVLPGIEKIKNIEIDPLIHPNEEKSEVVMKLIQSFKIVNQGAIFKHLKSIQSFELLNEKDVFKYPKIFNIISPFDTLPEVCVRENFRDHFTFTLDGPNTLSLEDAISFNHCKNDNTYELGFHAIDIHDNFKRNKVIHSLAIYAGFSLYFSNKNYPMLMGHNFKNSSIKVGIPCNTISLIMKFDETGKFIKSRLCFGVIENQLKLDFSKNYDENLDLTKKEKFTESLNFIKKVIRYCEEKCYESKVKKMHPSLNDYELSHILYRYNRHAKHILASLMYIKCPEIKELSNFNKFVNKYACVGDNPFLADHFRISSPLRIYSNIIGQYIVSHSLHYPERKHFDVSKFVQIFFWLSIRAVQHYSINRYIKKEEISIPEDLGSHEEKLSEFPPI